MGSIVIAATAATLASIAPNTLLVDVGTDAETDPGDGSIHSFYHLVGSATDGGTYTLEEATRAIMHQIAIGALVPATGATPSVRTCRQCGCTDEFACDQGCEWVERDLCTSCVGGRR